MKPRHGNVDNDVGPLPLKPKGVTFDMDGTLIRHSIDFADVRRQIYNVADSDPIGKHLERTCVLTLAKQLSAEGQIKAKEIIADTVKRALEDMELMPGGAELLSFLRENNLKRAVLTTYVTLKRMSIICNNCTLIRWANQRN
jgi:beta-phosphoglucomutase-like phosphatase (HAD superfamily)